MVASKRFLIGIINKKCVKALITNTQMNNLIKGRFNRQYENLFLVDYIYIVLILL